MQMQIQDWLIDVDVEQTNEYYSKRRIEDSCECLSCRNYKAAAGSFPEEVRLFFASLGIDPQKIVGEIMECGDNGDGTRHYSGWYHLLGTILQGPVGDTTERWRELNLLELDRFTFGFSTRLQLIAEDFPRPAIQLEFEALLPWVLREKPED